MTEKKTFSLFTYNSWFLVLSMIAFALLGSGILFIFQSILDIPAWILYTLLTLWLAVDFLFSSYVAARPTTFIVNDSGLSLIHNLETTIIPWKDISSNDFYEELLLTSIILHLKNKETVSIIDFKWYGKRRIYPLYQSMHPYLADEQSDAQEDPGNKTAVLIKSNLKTILGIIFFMVYVNISLKLDESGIIKSWNPIAAYFYWVLPILTFFKLVFTK